MLLAVTASAQGDQKSDIRFSGSWHGSLQAGTAELRLIFNITLSEDGLSATMDSPDQGAMGIALGGVTVTGDSLTIAAPVLGGIYRGVITSDSSITGLWSQMGQSYPLDLKLKYEPVTLNRPQEPQPPYPYSEEEVLFENSETGDKFAGTVTRPSEEGRYPAVILVSGSGQQNRDEEVFGHKPFKVLADYLTRKGIVVLRYDDRGVGGSTGNPSGATSADFATDAAAAFSYLESLPYVSKNVTGIIGHSEGGLIALMLAAESRDVDFIVTLAGPGTTGREILIDQSEIISQLSGIPEETIEINNALNSAIYNIMEEEDNVEEAVKLIREEVEKMLDREGVQSEQREAILSSVTGSVNESSYNWLRYFILSDPAEYLKKIECPVFALNGEKDCQVPAAKNLEAIENALAEGGNVNVTVKLFPGLNHLFQHAGSGLPDEYSKIEETISPEVLTLIAEWIASINTNSSKQPAKPVAKPAADHD